MVKGYIWFMVKGSWFMIRSSWLRASFGSWLMING